MRSRLSLVLVEIFAGVEPNFVLGQFFLALLQVTSPLVQGLEDLLEIFRRRLGNRHRR